MNRVYHIGRAEDCGIILYSPEASREHAMLEMRGRRCFISDFSSNGTFINGVRIKSGVPVSVSRKDVITFAGGEMLDWREIPNPRKTAAVISAASTAVIAAILIIVLTIGRRPVEDGSADMAADSLSVNEELKPPAADAVPKHEDDAPVKTTGESGVQPRPQNKDAIHESWYLPDSASATKASSISRQKSPDTLKKSKGVTEKESKEPVKRDGDNQSNTAQRETDRSDVPMEIL